MLKKRIIGVVLVKAGIVVQSIGFKRYLPVGKPEIAINYLDRWGVDEIAVLHLDAMANKQMINSEQIKSYADQCQVPLSIGGGITQVDDIKRIIRAGADKVVINTSLVSSPDIITQGADLFGQQSIVASIDVRRQAKGSWLAFTNSGTQSTGMTPQQLALRAEKYGAGEILINSIDCDGAKQGYDLELIQTVAESVGVPVIACGGAGHPEHVRMVMQSGAAAAAVGNYFHFTEHSVTLAKRFLQAKQEPVRLDGYFTYHQAEFDSDGRVIKQPDALLDALRFQYIPEEVI